MSELYETFLLTRLQSLWEAAVAAETAARQGAVTAEETARMAAVTAEENARKAAVSAEAAARTTAVNNVAATVPRVVSGTYVGSTTASNYTVTQVIDLGGRPKAVWVVRNDGIFNPSGQSSAAIVGPNSPVYRTTEDNFACRVVSNGFEVKNISSQNYLNVNERTYNYVAIL